MRLEVFIQEVAMAELIDMSNPDIRERLARAKAAGSMTYDELNELLPCDEMTAEEIDEVVRSVVAMGINLVDQEGGASPNSALRER